MASSIAQLNPEGGLPGHIEDLYAIEGQLNQHFGEVAQKWLYEQQAS
jgi:hypothetical protein